MRHTCNHVTVVVVDLELYGEVCRDSSPIEICRRCGDARLPRASRRKPGDSSLLTHGWSGLPLSLSSAEQLAKAIPLTGAYRLRLGT